MRWPMSYFLDKYPCQVAIYQVDGSVAITHGGIEMGQGLNTRVAQVVAKTLEVPMDKISVKASNNFVGNNSYASSGSRSSMLTSSVSALEAVTTFYFCFLMYFYRYQGGP